MSRAEVHLERLIGRQVLDLRGRPIGRLMEVRAEHRRGALEVTEYVIGALGLVERLAMQPLFHHAGGYLARWDQVDLGDPARPRLTCPTSELTRKQ